MRMVRAVMVLVCELITIGALLAFTAAEWFSISRSKESLDKAENELWYVRARRTGPAKGGIRSILLGRRNLSERIALGEERYLAGNRLVDDLYIDASGKRVRLFINVQKDKVFLTVLRGSVFISTCVYEADKTKRVEIKDMTKVVVSDVELEFIRKRVM